jgi:hypothetical protein
MKNHTVLPSTVAALTLAAATTPISMPVHAQGEEASSDVAVITKIVKDWIQADLAGHTSYDENQLRAIGQWA